MKDIKKIKECLSNKVLLELDNIDNINTHELGKVIDMIKDLSQSIYYCSISEAMEDEKSNTREYYRNKYDKMYYEDIENPLWDTHIRDTREGRSPKFRKMYMESKEMHQEKDKQMKELEKYIKELGEDVYEMIMDATGEEKTMLSQKFIELANKINSNVWN